MSRAEYEESGRLASSVSSFYALIMAAMRRADSSNLAKLRDGFPGTWAELDERYNVAGGYTVAELVRVRCSDKCPTLPTVYLWCEGSFGTRGDQHWVALANDGHVLAEHVCSHESFAELDLHARRQDVYVRRYGGFGHGEFYHLEQIPLGSRPPDEVLASAAALAEDIVDRTAEAMRQDGP